MDDRTAPEDPTDTEPPATPCPKKTWCILPADHHGSCRRWPEGTPESVKKAAKNSRRSAGASTNRAVQRPRRTSKPNLAPAVLGMAYGQVGSMIEASAPEPAGPPVGRVMQFQAPLAGQQLDALLANLPIYKRVTQAGASQLVEQLAGLIIAPLLAGLMASNENVAMTLYPIFASTIRASAVEIVKAQRAQVAAMTEIDEYTAEADELTRQFMEAMLAPREQPNATPADA